MGNIRHINIKPTYDLVAKKIFSDSEITATFIKDILDLPVKNAKLLDTGQVSLDELEEDIFVYTTALDVLAELEDGTKVIIEIQISKQTYFMNRMWVYICNQVTKNVSEVKKRGIATHKSYGEVMPVYAIAVVEENYFKDDRAIRIFSIKDKETNEQLKIKLKNKEGEHSLMEMAVLELKKYKPELKDSYEKIRWLEFFGNQQFTKEPDLVIHRADDILEFKGWSEEEKRMYDALQRKIDSHVATMEYIYEENERRIEEGRAEGREEGIKQGLSKGREEGRTEGEIATYASLVKEGLINKELASKRLGITEEEFEKYL